MSEIKDKIVVWFMQNILIPKSEIIDKPGFIILKLTEAKQEINVRELFLPEKILNELEKKVVQQKGEEGKKALYSIGKKFGYRYAVLCKYPNIKNTTPEKINGFFYTFLRYMEAISFGRKLEFETNFKEKTYIMKMERYIVCSENGIGLVLTDGGSAGMWSYTLQDFEIEGTQTKCHGRGDPNCEVICAPIEYFKNKKQPYFTETNLASFTTISPNYNLFNSLKPLSYCKTSLKDLIHNGIFNFKSGQLEHNGERYALTEASLMYLLESGLKQVQAENILFEAAFEFAKKLTEQEKTNKLDSFAMSFLSAIGFGDTLIIKKEGKYFIQFDSFPWAEFAENSDFLMIKGLVSGLLSKEKVVKLGKAIKDTKTGSLAVLFNEE